MLFLSLFKKLIFAVGKILGKKGREATKALPRHLEKLTS
jgi:hypothetical protein